jgi:hypothetical protein
MHQRLFGRAIRWCVRLQGSIGGGATAELAFDAPSGKARVHVALQSVAHP